MRTVPPDSLFQTAGHVDTRSQQTFIGHAPPTKVALNNPENSTVACSVQSGCLISEPAIDYRSTEITYSFALSDPISTTIAIVTDNITDRELPNLVMSPLQSEAQCLLSSING